MSPDLRDWRITVVMAAGSERRSFTVTVPAVGQEAARTAAYGLGWAINEGSGHLWKITDEILVEEATR